MEGADSPLDMLLRIMRCEEVPLERRLQAAIAAAPFCHHKLAAIQHSGPAGGPVRIESEMTISFD
jgi:hypothetical protein